MLSIDEGDEDVHISAGSCPQSRRFQGGPVWDLSGGGGFVRTPRGNRARIPTSAALIFSGLRFTPEPPCSRFPRPAATRSRAGGLTVVMRTLGTTSRAGASSPTRSRLAARGRSACRRPPSAKGFYLDGEGARARRANFSRRKATQPGTCASLNPWRRSGPLNPYACNKER